MEYSICIVSKNRKSDLDKTISILLNMVDLSAVEVLVALDGATDGSNDLIATYDKIKWYSWEKSIGASPARNRLFKECKGNYIFGFDDDSHPLQDDFIERCVALFNHNKQLAVISFEEIKGIYTSDKEAWEHHKPARSFLCNSFVGCGYVIRKDYYDQTSGFPQWMKIYGEESCVSIELLDLGYTIQYDSSISVNHRVNRNLRKSNGANQFRFREQLLNSANFILIYYPKERILKSLARLFYHNLKKYAVTSPKLMWYYCTTIVKIFYRLKGTLVHRKPVKTQTFITMQKLPHPLYG